MLSFYFKYTKTNEGYYTSFDFITFEKIISNSSIFVADTTTK